MQGWRTKWIETAGGTSGLLRPPCIATPAVFLSTGDVKMRGKRINLFAPRLCKCGCGQEVKPGNVYILGHYWNGRVGPRQGTHHTEEAKKKMALSHEGQPSTRKGKHLTEETKRKISLARKGQRVTEETKRKISRALKGKPRPPEVRRKISLAHIGIPLSLEHKRKTTLAIRQVWKDPVRAKKILAKWWSVQRPTKPEKHLLSLLNRHFPNEYKYVGDGKVIIGGKNPDFINVNGQKKIIEMFGRYWHEEEQTGINNMEHRKQRERHFAKYGYQTLVVWQWELKNIPKLKAKIRKFHRC